MATITEPTLTMTTRLPVSLKAELDALAEVTGQGRDTLVRAALRRFIDLEQRQIEEIEAGIREADAGIFVSDEEMDEMWAEFGLEPGQQAERRE